MNRSKRGIILERLAQEFEPGTHYSEAEVSSSLLRFHDDYAALRRYLVEDDPDPEVAIRPIEGGTA